MDLRLADLLARVVRYYHHTLVNSATAREALRRLVVGVDAGPDAGGGMLEAGQNPSQRPASTTQPPDPLAPSGVEGPPNPRPASVTFDAALIDRFTLGFVDGTIHQVIPAKGEVVEALRLLGILDKAGRERFTGCVTVPVFDEQERVVQVAFYDTRGGARSLPAEARLVRRSFSEGGRAKEGGAPDNADDPGGHGGPPLQWLFDETPSFWNEASKRVRLYLNYIDKGAFRT